MFASNRSSAPSRAASRILAVLVFACVPADPAFALTFTVNDTTDAVDETPGDGICRTLPNNTNCTLRAAVTESNARAGADTIILQANTTYVLTRVGVDDTSANGDLDLTDSLTIVGAGPASTIIDGNGVATGDRILQAFRCIGNAPFNGQCTNGDVFTNISGVTLRGGRSEVLGGSGIHNSSDLTLENVAVVENATQGPGGGIASFGVLVLINTTVANNSAGENGAGVVALGQLVIHNSSIRDNHGVGPGLGGGVHVTEKATAVISDSTISGNLAATGGGIYSSSSTIFIVNSTISGNSATSLGGGFYIGGGGVELYNVTIAANVANSDDVGTGRGGGIFDASAIVELSNSILTANYIRNEGTFFDTLNDCVGNFNSSGFNIVSNPGPECNLVGGHLSADPLLGPLQDNGGDTTTHALQVGSPAIDAGNPAGCSDGIATLTTDQRGEPRPFGPACDLGAFELGDMVFGDSFE